MYELISGECCFYIFKRCCVASKQIDYFNDVADLINDIFEDEAFVPTDIAAALILLAERNNCAQNLSDQELRYICDNKCFTYVTKTIAEWGGCK